MSNPINRIIDTGVHRLPERNGAGAPHAGQGQAQSARSEQTSDLLDLTGRAQQLKALEHELAQSQEFDATRVAELRQSISDGSYQVDAGRIADKLLSMESKLP